MLLFHLEVGSSFGPARWFLIIYMQNGHTGVQRRRCKDAPHDPHWPQSSPPWVSLHTNWFLLISLSSCETSSRKPSLIFLRRPCSGIPLAWGGSLIRGSTSGWTIRKEAASGQTALRAYGLGKGQWAPSRWTQPFPGMQGLVSEVWTRFQPPLTACYWSPWSVHRLHNHAGSPLQSLSDSSSQHAFFFFFCMCYKHLFTVLTTFINWHFIREVLWLKSTCPTGLQAPEGQHHVWFCSCYLPSPVLGSG